MHDERLLFDEAWYLDTNPDVAAAGLDPWWQHYIHYGCAEGRPLGQATSKLPRTVTDGRDRPPLFEKLDSRGPL
jgi:hypothetical protein